MSSVSFPNWFPWAPQALDQRFNNGWTFGNVNVTLANSRAPEVEREVVSRHSYGRQIGRLMDAVVRIAAKTGTQDDPQVKPLIELARQIEDIKAKARQDRAKDLLDELKLLKRTDPKAWADLMKAVSS
ncbi:hypothetical protein [Piscinibacter sp. XHJ-5]|uniref:hypothetical protein n=1 Tax=Piscinibacter sp. XHJ-5 TaxID=3037797 RepID=UPI002452E47E|nr:hypothetical protein [Piscinibacter sp. XHJ-5]